MGEITVDQSNKLIIIEAIVTLYGQAASDELGKRMAMEIQDNWNAPMVELEIKNKTYRVEFNISSRFSPNLSRETVHHCADARLNFFRVEEFSRINISFVDGSPSNTGYFLYDNLINNSSTAAHEFGHTLGLLHPEELNIIGQGQPGIMYPRGTLVDPAYQYDPAAAPGAPGGTLHPAKRKVLKSDIEQLGLGHIILNPQQHFIGAFTNQYHEAHLRL